MQGKKKTCIWRAEGGKGMRRTKRFASFALAACMGVSLLVNVPAGTVSAAEPEKTVTSSVEGMTEEAVPGATGTDAEALDETQEVVDTFEQLYQSAAQLREIADKLVAGIDYFKIS